MLTRRGLLLGAHMSITGGYYKAVEKAAALGMSTCQIFTKNNNQWRAKPITAAEADQFQGALRESGVVQPISHASYLINLASPDPALRRKSIDAFVIELRRAEQLGIGYVVLHPGSYTTSSESEGLANVIASLDEVHRQTPGVTAHCLLENTAGQGSNLGWQFEQLQSILDGVKHTERLGVCFDTCHAFAAGYPLAQRKDYLRTMRELNRTVGVVRIKAFHLNDSRRELGSRVDRHEHIGRGQIGLDAFRHLLADRRFRGIPKYLETPKGDENGEELDVVNLRTLRSLVG